MDVASDKSSGPSTSRSTRKGDIFWRIGTFLSLLIFYLYHDFETYNENRVLTLATGLLVFVVLKHFRTNWMSYCSREVERMVRIRDSLRKALLETQQKGGKDEEEGLMDERRATIALHPLASKMGDWREYIESANGQQLFSRRKWTSIHDPLKSRVEV